MTQKHPMAASLPRWRVGWCLFASTANVLVALTFLGLVLLSGALLVGWLWGFVLTTETLEFAIFAGIFIVVASPFTVYLHRPQRATAENAPELMAAMQACPVLLKPRLVIVEMGAPNAFAVGWWPFSFLAVSEELLAAVRSDSSPLDQAALNAIVAHEIGHHILGHSLFSPVFAVAAWMCDRALPMLRGGTLRPGMMLLYVLALALSPLLKLIQATFSQEFEFAADAVSTLYCGSPQGLITALAALAPYLDRTAASPLTSILASHPGTEARIKRLQSFQPLQLAPQTSDKTLDENH
ncbi:MAG: M48 family metalloprotease [Synechococcales bacterium]|nr:M48 family metalloprotease [Synechococcales bacterium]